MLPAILTILSMAKQKADAEEANKAQLAQNIKNQNVTGQQQPTLQLPQQQQQQQQQNTVNRLRQVMSLFGK